MTENLLTNYIGAVGVAVIDIRTEKHLYLRAHHRVGDDNPFRFYIRIIHGVAQTLKLLCNRAFPASYSACYSYQHIWLVCLELKINKRLHIRRNKLIDNKYCYYHA